jgi:SAM-dependent methyltransferase
MIWWRIAKRIQPRLASFYLRLSRPPAPNLEGDREIEYSWIAGNMGQGPGQALDFGCGKSWMALLAARRGFDVTAIDLGQVRWSYEHPHLDFIRGNLAKSSMKPDSFDLIINCSSIEHVGLKGRYGVTEAHLDGDLEMMGLLRRILRPGKEMLLTIPVGRDRVVVPRHRVYGKERLPKLLEGWDVMHSEYWAKDGSNRWSMWDENLALNVESSDHYYGLGLFVLRRPEQNPAKDNQAK